MDIILKDKERQIVDFVSNQEFVFYSDIKNKFFKTYPTCSEKISELKRKRILFTFKPNEIQINSSLYEKARYKKIVCLGEGGLKLYRKRKPSKFKVNHQVLLFSIKEELESFFGVKGIYESEIRELKGTIKESRNEPYPDFFIKTDQFKLAVELELNLKSNLRYRQKRHSYLSSTYTHILYVTQTDRMKDRLVQFFGYDREFATALYRDVKKPFSKSFGKFYLENWVNGRL